MSHCSDTISLMPPLYHVTTSNKSCAEASQALPKAVQRHPRLSQKLCGGFPGSPKSCAEASQALPKPVQRPPPLCLQNRLRKETTIMMSYHSDTIFLLPQTDKENPNNEVRYISLIPPLCLQNQESHITNGDPVLTGLQRASGLISGKCSCDSMYILDQRRLDTVM